MLLNKILAGASIVIILMVGFSSESHHSSTLVQGAEAAGTVSIAVGPQYDTTDVYVARQDFDRFVASLTATFGGTTTKQGVFTVTPTPSSTMSQLVLTPVGDHSSLRFQDANPLSVWRGAHGLSSQGPGCGCPRSSRNRCGCHRRSLQRRYWAKRHNPVAGWRQYSALVSHHSAILRVSPVCSRKSRLCLR